ncbi:MULTISPECIES: AsmA family protein [unclassified Achromobacter]|uniref:AsmA family protein n=1 Tax=unclassified Achromobacter TaxID=2626865 RepID=UPI000B516948|nr:MULTISPECIES: AsmA family protein [unclassified Achromobacter]OWT72733.1 AsmA family protein [Achromobacter sp. HZ34]OWT73952.1 AsmA family protein [Achromobacter sp. HZ28]
MARKHKILTGIVTVLILFLVVVVIVIATFDWNRAKPYIDSKATDALGRPFAINGDLSVAWQRETDEGGWRAWVPWPHVTANDITIGNTEWGQAPQFAQLKQAQFSISLLGLLSHRVIIRRIQLTQPSADLERLADGRANWVFTPKKQDEQQAEPATPWTLDVNQIGFDKGRVGYKDVTLQADVEVTVDPLGKPVPFAQLAGAALAGVKPDAAPGNQVDTKPGTKPGTQPGTQPGAQPAAPPSPQPNTPPATASGGQADAQAAAPGDYVFGWAAKGRFKGLDVSGEGKAGGMLALQDGNNPFPVQADVALGHTKASVVGTVTNPMHVGALDLRLKLSGNSMSDLYPLTGVTLPDTPPYSTDGHLTARLNDAQGSVFEYQNFNGKVGNSDIHGDVTYAATKPRPKLTGKFTSQLLRFADLGPLVGADTGKKGATDASKVAAAERTSAAAAAKAAKDAAASGDHPQAQAKQDEAASHSTAATRAQGSSPAQQPADKALPVQEFRTERWRDMDADVSLEAKRIVQTDNLPITNLQAHVVLDNGVLTLRPLRFGMAGGSLTADIQLDGSKRPMPASAKISARKLQLKQLFPGVKSMEKSLGELNGDAALSGNGNSVAQLMATSNGETKLLINDGVISRSLMELAGLNVGNYVVSKLFGDDEVNINCGAADLGFKDGIATPRIFVFDTENTLVEIQGSVNFKTEALDLDITPHSKGLRIISLRSPLYVAGTLKNPKPGVKTLPLAARGAGAVALGALLTPAAGLLALIVPSASEEKENECGTMLREIRQPPKAPPPKAAPRSAKPAAR